MKKIRVNIFKIKNHYYAKLPDIVAEQLQIDNGQDIEISIYNKDNKEWVSGKFAPIYPSTEKLAKSGITNKVIQKLMQAS